MVARGRSRALSVGPVDDSEEGGGGRETGILCLRWSDLATAVKCVVQYWNSHFDAIYLKKRKKIDARYDFQYHTSIKCLVFFY